MSDVPRRTHFLAQRYAGIALTNQFVYRIPRLFEIPSMAIGVFIKPGMIVFARTLYLALSMATW